MNNYNVLTLFFLALFLGLTETTSAQTQFYSNDFETDNGGWTDGGNDARYATNESNSPQGNDSWELKDNSGLASSMYQNFDLSSYNEITLDFSLLSVGFDDNKDGFEILIDGTQVAEYQFSNWGSNKVIYTASLTISEGNLSFDASTEITFRTNDRTGNNDKLYLDEFVFTGNFNCNPTVTNAGSASDGITRVQIGDIDNATGIDTVDGYIDYTNLSTTIYRGTSTDLSVNVNTDGNYQNFTSAWIDWNGDGLFDESTEREELGENINTADSPTSLSPLSISIPADATLGSTVLRIITRYGNLPVDACSDLTYGEIEDYTLIIADPVSVDNPTLTVTNATILPYLYTRNDINISSNSNNDHVVVAFNTSDSFGQPSGTYSAGDVISGGGTVIGSGLANTILNHTNLPQATTYYYKAWSINNGTYSSGTSTVSETTTAVPAPTSMTATASGTSVTFSVNAAANSHNLMLVYNTSDTFTDLIDGTKYTNGDVLSNGDTVLKANENEASVNQFTQTGVSENTTYYYRLYTKIESVSYYSDTYVSTNITTDCFSASEISNVSASTSSEQVTVSWTNPASCFDEVLVIAKAASAVTGAPSGDGTTYTASSVFGNGTEIVSDEFVVYKGSSNAVTVTGLTNDVLYYFKIFVRKSNLWSDGVSTSATPVGSVSLIISEIADPKNGDAYRFIELYNNGSSAIDLATINAELKIYDASGNGSVDATIDLTGTIKAGEVFVVVRQQYSGTTSYNANVVDSSMGIADKEAIYLWANNQILDAYGDNTVTANDADFDYKDSRSYRNNPKTVTPNASWDSSEWTVVVSNTWFSGTSPGYLDNEYRLLENTSGSELWLPSDPGSGDATKDLAITRNYTFTGVDFDIKDVNVLTSATLNVAFDASIHARGNLVNKGSLSMTSDAEEFSSLIVEGTASGDIIYNRWVNNFEGVSAYGNDVVGSPLYGEEWQSVKANNESIIYNNGTLYSFSPYLSGFGGWTNYYTSTTETTIESGQGYRVATFQNNSAPVKFTGTLQTGTVNVNLRRVNNPWNVVGNPYTSYIDVNKFLTANADVLDDTRVYVLGYNGSENESYWTYFNANIVEGGASIAPGQGFYVAAKNDNVTLTFTPDMRTVAGTDDFIVGRSEQVTIHKFKLNIKNGDNNRHTEFYFRDIEEVTNEFDKAYDGVIKDDGDNFMVYSKLIANSSDEKLAFQTAPTSSLLESNVAIGVNLVSGQQFTFSLDNVDIPEETLVYLEDRDKDTWTLLNDDNTYTINTTETINGSERFFLHFEANESLSNNEFDLTNIGIKSVNSTKQLIISGQLAEDTQVNIYDVSGKLIMKTTIDAYKDTNRIDVKNFITGIYLVQLNNSTQVTAKQVLIK